MLLSSAMKEGKSVFVYMLVLTFQPQLLVFSLRTCCSTGTLGENQQQEIQYNFTGLFHTNMFTFIYGCFLLMTILLVADQGNFSDM